MWDKYNKKLNMDYMGNKIKYTKLSFSIFDDYLFNEEHKPVRKKKRELCSLFAFRKPNYMLS